MTSPSGHRGNWYRTVSRIIVDPFFHRTGACGSKDNMILGFAHRRTHKGVAILLFQTATGTVLYRAAACNQQQYQE
jgi:hypothetical protein